MLTEEPLIKMQVKVDMQGRICIPSEIRERAKFKESQELDIILVFEDVKPIIELRKRD